MGEKLKGTDLGEKEVPKAISGVSPAILVSAEQYCRDKSKTDKRVELLGSFYYFLVSVKKIPKATRAQYDALFAEFTTKPAARRK